MSWKVLADAGLVARVEPVLEAIYGVLEGSRWLPVGDLPPSRQPSLAGGLAGQALFCAYYGHARGRPDAEETALALLEQSLVAAAEQPLAGGLYGGFSGVGWAVEHLAGRCYEAGEDATADSEQEIVAFLEGGAADFPWELIQGLSGLALYLLERPRPARPALLRVVDALEASARADERGLYWFTPAEWVPEPQREDSPAGQMNLGVAHGITGVLGLLACLELAGLGDPRLRHLSEGAVSWLLAHRLPAGGSSRVPAWIAVGREPEPTRTAWCYGDPGAAAVLSLAAAAFHRPDWQAEALELGRLAARRPISEVRALDAGLCHGSAGLCHLFNRLWQASGDAELETAAIAWLERTLALRVEGEGLAGFRTWEVRLDRPARWMSDPGFLTGIAGTGLALLAATSELEPAWDRLLLASGPASALRWRELEPPALEAEPVLTLEEARP